MAEGKSAKPECRRRLLAERITEPTLGRGEKSLTEHLGGANELDPGSAH
jgi:hypothetical protein